MKRARRRPSAEDRGSTGGLSPAATGAGCAEALGELPQGQVHLHGPAPMGEVAGTPPAHQLAAGGVGQGATVGEADPVLLPWMTSTGQRTRRASSRLGGLVGSRSAEADTTRVSGPVSTPQPTMSSPCLVECGSGKTSAEDHSTKSR